MGNCNCTPVMCDGSGRLQRYLKALDPQNTPIDGRTMEDILVFAKRYAAQIRFYDLNTGLQNNTATEQQSWKEFFRRDLAVIVSSIAITDLQKVKKDYNEIREDLQTKADPDIFAALFDPLLGIGIRLDTWYSLSLPGNPLYNDIHLAITSRLKQQVQKLKAYEAAYKLIDIKHQLKLDFSKFQNVDLWGINEDVQPITEIYDGVTYEEKIRNAALYIDDIFNAFYYVLEEFVGRSDSYFQFALEQYPEHKPHMALFISFIQLFLIAQEQLNGITERMLNFYYRDVLNLSEKPAIPDNVHVVFELAKGIQEYAMPAGTALKAGKDASGVEQIYTTQNEIVINQAKVKELKTVFINKKIRPATGDIKEAVVIDSFYARPVANSKDGFGTAFDDATGKWPTFGVGDKADINTGTICDKISNIVEENTRIDQAQVGFAIASPQLLLQGGRRLILFSASGFERLITQLGSTVLENGKIEIWLTGEKGWVKIQKLITPEIIKNYLQPAITDGAFMNEPENMQSSFYYVNGGLYIYLPIGESGIINYNVKIHSAHTFETTQPVMCVMFNTSLGIEESEYSSILATGASLAVKVGSLNTEANKGRMPNMDGLKIMYLQNDDGPIAPGKPFHPFTALPGYGKSLYVGSDEVFNKPIYKLTVNLKPVQSASQVTNIEANILKATTLSSGGLDVSLLYNREWLRLATKTNSDFTIYQLTANILHLKNFGNGVPSPYVTRREPINHDTIWDSKTEKGFLSITLPNMSISVGDNESILQKRMELAQKLEIKEISLSYESDLYSLKFGIDQIFHVYPFGTIETSFLPEKKYEEVFVLRNQPASSNSLVVDANNILLPQFTYVDPYSTLRQGSGRHVITNIDTARDKGKYLQVYRKVATSTQSLAAEMMLAGNRQMASQNDQYSGDKQEQGMLFIGLENLKALQTVSLLFQFAEGSAEDEDNTSPEIHWSYLSNNRWIPLPGENLVSDGTYGFQTTGIMKFDIPADATTTNTIITSGLIWLCASVSEHAERVPQLINIFSQAVQVGFADNGNAASHYDEALPANSIAKLNVPVAAVGKVQQPFASFDGKHKEEGKEFYMRVSERLRHKGRAITAWDYEHLVLDRFPQIYKVKCISQLDPDCICRKKTMTDANNESTEVCCGSQIAPGHVLIVPISDLKNRNSVNPLQPKTSKRTLLAIEDYLKKRTSPFVKVHAKNPKYEQVIVAFQVQFYSGVDKGYYLKKLNDEIVEYLTPWAFTDKADVSFGQKIYASSIINFIEERSYVDFITDFKMAVCDDPCCPKTVDKTADKDKTPAEIFSEMDNCNEWESFLENALSKSAGEIVATPSTPRSILVSAPKHIIVPYVAPVEVLPCEKRKLAERNIIVLPDVKKDVVVIKEPVKMENLQEKNIKEVSKETIVKEAIKTPVPEKGLLNTEKNYTLIKKVATKKSPAKKASKKNTK